MEGDFKNIQLPVFIVLGGVLRSPQSKGNTLGRPCVAGDPSKEERNVGAAPEAGVSLGMVKSETIWVS